MISAKEMNSHDRPSLTVACREYEGLLLIIAKLLLRAGKKNDSITVRIVRNDKNFDIMKKIYGPEGLFLTGQIRRIFDQV